MVSYKNPKLILTERLEEAKFRLNKINSVILKLKDFEWQILLRGPFNILYYKNVFKKNSFKKLYLQRYKMSHNTNFIYFSLYI